MEDKTVSSTEKELDAFRTQWRQEVASRQKQQGQQQGQQQKRLSQNKKTAANDIHTLSKKTEELSLQQQDTINNNNNNNNNNNQLDNDSEDVSNNIKSGSETSKLKEEKMEEVVVKKEENEEEEEEEEEEEGLGTAMEYYIKAIDHEREGQLGKALTLYRHAFRLDRDIDFAYKKHYQTHIAPLQQQQEDQPPGTTLTSGEQEDGSFKHIIPIGIEYEPSKVKKKEWNDPLQHLMDELSQQDINYIPLIDYKPILIAKLPNEILIMIFKKLLLESISSCANIALVCKRFFLLTRSQSLWKYLCEQAYRPPHLSLEESQKIQLNHVQRDYSGSWLRMYIERPRIRYDGIYIATCHYIRHGTSDSSWNQPIHLITYYRYLRFFTDGTILKHVTTEEPAHVVKLLNKPFSRRQTFHGKFQWQKDRDTNEPILKIVSKDVTNKNEKFYLTLSIKSTHKGRHNKLGWKRYTSINGQKLEQRQQQRQQQQQQQQDSSSSINYNDYDYDDGHEDIESEYDLKLMKPFYFSPVRSYYVDYPNDILI